MYCIFEYIRYHAFPGHYFSVSDARRANNSKRLMIDRRYKQAEQGFYFSWGASVAHSLKSNLI